MSAFVKALSGEQGTLVTSARDFSESHLMAFAAEESRLQGGKIVDMDEYRARIEAKVSSATP
jgi:hypothetical protein